MEGRPFSRTLVDGARIGPMASGAWNPRRRLRLPIARANAWPSRAAQGNRAPGATRSRAQRDAGTASGEHGEDGEDATLPCAARDGMLSARWASAPMTAAVQGRDDHQPARARWASAP